jgi:hypothetical protein
MVYPFVNSRRVIDTVNMQDGQLIKFLENAFDAYEDLKTYFRIHKVIEYYIFALTIYVLQERFTIGYMALEYLANAAIVLSKRHGDTPAPQALEDIRI